MKYWNWRYKRFSLFFVPFFWGSYCKEIRLNNGNPYIGYKLGPFRLDIFEKYISYS